MTEPSLQHSPRPLRLSVILPAYNEEECIEKSATDALAFLEERFPDHELLLVNDGSTDSTGARIERLSALHPTIRHLEQPRNLGYGAALVRGFRAARGDFVFYTDSDGQFDIAELRYVLERMAEAGADAVFGYRIYRYDPLVRRFLSWAYNRLVRVLFRVQVRDIDCAFKVFKREVLTGMRLDSTDFFIDTELVARTHKLGFKTIEIGVRHYPRRAGRTSVRPSHIPLTLWTVFRMARSIHLGSSRLPETPASALEKADSALSS